MLVVMYFVSLFGFRCHRFFFVFFFNDTATTEIYTLSLHDALPIFRRRSLRALWPSPARYSDIAARSEEHTSELQSHSDLVCRLLLEKKKNKNYIPQPLALPAITSPLPTGTLEK